MPAIERAPEPRPRPSSTVSAWSSSVCPSSTSAPSHRCESSPSTAYLASRAAVDAVGMDGFNAVWAGPENLPSKAEIGDPAAWVRRVHG